MSPLLAALQRLYESPAMKASGSLFTKAQRNALDHFIQQTRSVSCKQSGRGVVYHVLQQPVVEQHIRSLSPSYFDTGISDKVPNRAVNIANARSSKSGKHSHSPYYLLMRPCGDSVRWQNRNTDLDLNDVSQKYGVATLQIAPGDNWSSGQPLWLVENQALFDSLDWLPKGTQASVHWYRGQLSHTFLDWLSERERTTEVVLFPDYDGVGLSNYARLHQRLGNRCSLWFMPNWEVKLPKYGNNDIWVNTFKDFKTAAEYFTHLPHQDETLKSLFTALTSQGLALEQEAVWL
jgi:hypothetical protein